MSTTRAGGLAVLAVSAPLLMELPVTAQETTIVERNDAVGNVIIIDDKLVRNRTSPGGESGIRVNPGAITPEAQAKEQAIENRLDNRVRPNRPPALVKGRMDNIVQVEGVFAIKRFEDDKVCVEIGTVGGGDDCREPE